MRVLISGGGTGGHIYPALSILKEIKKREPQSKFLYVGSANGLEADIVKKENIPFHSINITGLYRKFSFKNIKTVFNFLKGVNDSKKIISFFKPDIVIGTGGYVCGPVVFAATKMNVPTLIHEQNVVPGLTNKFLSRYTSAVALSFEGSAKFFRSNKLTRITGNPRGSEVIEADAVKGKESLGLNKHEKVILVVGGSLGAKAINQAFLDIVDQIDKLKNCQFIYVTGKLHYDKINETLKMKALPDRVHIYPFIYNMPDVLATTDLIINRAGASFLAEITALGIPSILIPSPYVTNNHQEKNARWLETEGAAQVILEKNLTGSSLLDMINKIIYDEEKLNQMKQRSKKLGLPDASANIYHLIKELI